MTEDNRLSRAEVLIEQKKYADAEKILTNLLAEYSDNIHFLSLLAEVNLQQNKPDAANGIIDNAIALSPDTSHLFYTKSRIAIMQDKLGEAEKHIHQAISLEPYDADYFALLASIKLGRKDFNEALEAANKALSTDPENILALNIRSTALNKLNRSKEAAKTIEGALKEDPNNAYTHANYGWGLLEKGEYKKALEHFKEALSNDPSSDYAQSGILEAIKATNPIYRWFLKYQFWINNLKAQYQWRFLIGFFLVFRALKTLARNNETLQPYLTPLVIVLGLLAFSTWIITPISNLLLRFNKYGQLLLDKKQKMSANLVAASLGVFVVGLLLYFILSDERMLPLAIFGFLMMPPLGVVFSPSQKKQVLLIYTVALAITGIVAIAITFSTGKILNTMSFVFIIGFAVFQWVANYYSIKADNE